MVSYTSVHLLRMVLRILNSKSCRDTEIGVCSVPKAIRHAISSAMHTDRCHLCRTCQNLRHLWSNQRAPHPGGLSKEWLHHQFVGGMPALRRTVMGYCGDLQWVVDAVSKDLACSLKMGTSRAGRDRFAFRRAS